MAKPKRIIPEFMLDNLNDTFMFLMPLDLRPDDEDIGNSQFRVAVKNLTTKEYFTTLMSPEIFFTHFKLHKAYKSAKDENMSIDDIRKKYDGSSVIKFKTKNHERESELAQDNLAKWVVGILGKIII